MQADVPEAISGGNGEVLIEESVKPLTLEDQGERANIQNEISPLSVVSGQLGTGETVDDAGSGGPGDGGDGSCDGDACPTRMEGSLTPAVSLRKREFNAGDQTKVNSAGNGEVFIEGHFTPLTLENQGERANMQNESSQLSVVRCQLGTGDAAADGEGGGRLPGDGGDGSCDGELCRSRVEGTLTGEMEWDEERSREGAKTQREGREGRDLVTAGEDG